MTCVPPTCAALTPNGAFTSAQPCFDPEVISSASANVLSYSSGTTMYAALVPGVPFKFINPVGLGSTYIFERHIIQGTACVPSRSILLLLDVVFQQYVTYSASCEGGLSLVLTTLTAALGNGSAFGIILVPKGNAASNTCYIAYTSNTVTALLPDAGTASVSGVTYNPTTLLLTSTTPIVGATPTSMTVAVLPADVQSTLCSPSAPTIFNTDCTDGLLTCPLSATLYSGVACGNLGTGRYFCGASPSDPPKFELSATTGGTGLQSTYCYQCSQSGAVNTCEFLANQPGTYAPWKFTTAAACSTACVTPTVPGAAFGCGASASAGVVALTPGSLGAPTKGAALCYKCSTSGGCVWQANTNGLVGDFASSTACLKGCGAFVPGEFWRCGASSSAPPVPNTSSGALTRPGTLCFGCADNGCTWSGGNGLQGTAPTSSTCGLCTTGTFWHCGATSRNLPYADQSSPARRRRAPCAAGAAALKLGRVHGLAEMARRRPCSGATRSASQRTDALQNADDPRG